jgi:hypothetical protein
MYVRCVARRQVNPDTDAVFDGVSARYSCSHIHPLARSLAFVLAFVSRSVGRIDRGGERFLLWSRPNSQSLWKRAREKPAAGTNKLVGRSLCV